MLPTRAKKHSDTRCETTMGGEGRGWINECRNNCKGKDEVAHVRYV